MRGMEKESGARVKDGDSSIHLMSPEEINREETSHKIGLYFKHGKNGKRSMLNYYISKVIASDGPMCLQEMIQRLPKRWFTMNELANLVSKSRFFKERGWTKAIPMSNRSYMAPIWWFSDYFFNEIGGIDVES